MTAPMKRPDPLQAALAPMAMPDQNLWQRFRDPAAPGGRNGWQAYAARLFAFALPLAISIGLAMPFAGWFDLDGQLSASEFAIVLLSSFTIFWVALSVGVAMLGLLWRPAPAPRVAARDGLKVAIILPMYGEPAGEVIGNGFDLLRRLSEAGHVHSFALHVLSDSRTDEARRDEAAAMARFGDAYPRFEAHYRWREQNTDYKSGNLREWITTRGGAYDAMLILDADSIMGAGTVVRLADELAADPSLGLVQSLPRLLPGRTIWQRMQSFAAEVYGTNLGRGFAAYAGREGNFLGHNAIARIRAFATCAGLPHLTGRRPMGGIILSHDFVEAALLRRAGWGVRMIPEAQESFEETPENIPAYVKRDRRWSQGNMQHLRVMMARGLHPMSRMHFSQGAMAYLGSVFWAALLTLWALFGETAGVYRYFTEADPIRPTWRPLPDLSLAALAWVVVFLVLAPRVIGILSYVLNGRLARRDIGRFAGGVLAEAVLSALIAPMMMVQHSRAVIRTFAGFDSGWVPHMKGRPDLLTLLRFHWMETLIGAVLLPAVVMGIVTPWLVPLSLCLLLSVPLSSFVAMDFGREVQDEPLAPKLGGVVPGAGSA